MGKNIIQPWHYHADNGIFRENAWFYGWNNQDDPYYGVDTHHTNGMTQANYFQNKTPLLSYNIDWYPFKLFIRTRLNVNVKHWIPFECQIHLLWPELCYINNIYHKGKQQPDLSMYLEQYPTHKRNIELYRNRERVLVSLKYHIKCDTYFHIMNSLPDIYTY